MLLVVRPGASSSVLAPSRNIFEDGEVFLPQPPTYEPCWLHQSIVLHASSTRKITCRDPAQAKDLQFPSTAIYCVLSGSKDEFLGLLIHLVVVGQTTTRLSSQGENQGRSVRSAKHYEEEDDPDLQSRAQVQGRALRY